MDRLNRHQRRAAAKRFTVTVEILRHEQLAERIVRRAL
jgi:hypothetical protein